MNVKKMAKGITVIALLAIIAVGATLAYLTGTTETKKNVFTNSKTVDPSIKEEKWETEGKDQASKYQPGDVISKDPTVGLEANSETGFVGMKLGFYGDVTYDTDDNMTSGNSMTYSQFSKYAQYGNVDAQNIFTAGNTAGWEKIAYNEKGEELWIYNTEVTGGNSAPSIFNKIKVDTGITTVTGTSTKTLYTKTTKYDANGQVIEEKTEVQSGATLTEGTTYYDQDGNVVTSNKLPSFSIEASGYAVQSANVVLADAKTEMIKLANQGKTDADVGFFKAV